MERKNLRTKICIAVVILLFLAISAWRFFPRSFADIIPRDLSSASSISSAASIFGVADGLPFGHAYSLNITEDDQKIIQELTEILCGTSYRPDFRNLLPWEPDSIASHSGKSVTLLFVFGNASEDTYSIMFMGDGIVGVNGEKGFSIYHTPDDTVQNRLIDLLQQYGKAG